MYPINDQQITYILDDIRRRGIRMESLQESLLDHVCSLIEQNCKEGDDFEAFYATVIKEFYKKELREIEEETLLLIASKKDVNMKKAMVLSGAFSVAAFITGSTAKILQAPLAFPALVLGFLTIAFLFLPLLFIIKFREQGAGRDKLLWALGILVGILYCLSMLALFTHFRNKAMIWHITLAISFFVLIPVYFFTGIRNPEKRMTTIVVSVLMVAITGIQFSLTALHPPVTDKQPSAVQNAPLPGKTRPLVNDRGKPVFVKYQ
ncbi:MAG: hypothetical protein P4L51_13490 [Puia sp.]|nr:hypothetical protein [Puia sp.]